jgi:glycosyltransferase involved in cell wall biosynthesis
MKLDKFPKVLVITVNPLSNTSNNGKTIASFFTGYPKEKIAQLYFHREIPTSDICENYFKISDEDIIKNIFNRSKEIGKKIYMQDKEERIISEALSNWMKKSSVIRFIRLLIWALFNFEKEELYTWLDEFNPEVIFFCGGDANYLYNTTIRLSKRYNTKIIHYITDDYVLPYFSLKPFYLLTRLWTRKVFKRMCSCSNLILTIGSKMSRVYKEKYEIESEKIMNLVDVETNINEEINSKKNNLKFVYTGEVHSNRWKTLRIIGQSLERLNKYGLQASLEVYSQNKPDEKVLNALNNNNYSRYCGSLDSEGVKKVLKDSDVLVHVESFDSESQRVTYLSVSTKIPEYLSTGKCILAIGPEQVASIEYIKETNAGFVITSKDSSEIDSVLRGIILNPDIRNKYAVNALSTAEKNHDKVKESNEFQYKLKNL